MIAQITGTIASRVVIVAMAMLLTMVAGHQLGTEGLGIIGLVVLGISLVGLVANLLGGSALVYLAPRVPLRRLLVPAYSWAVVSCALGYGVLRTAGLVPEGYAAHTAILALLQSGISIHLAVLMGQQRIRTHNRITVLQALVTLFVFTALVLRPDPSPTAFVIATYCAYSVSLLLTTIALRTGPPLQGEVPADPLRLLIRQGALVQSANGMQLLNHRLAYWLIEKFRGTSALGLFSVATQLAEGAWLAPRSLGMVLYSRMSNTTDPVQQSALTVDMLKLSLASALAVLLVVLLMPGAVLTWLFGPEVQGLSPLLLRLAPGILAIAAAQAFSHYFSGTARNIHNVVSSGIGLVITLALGSWAIPRYGLSGAAMTASCAYIGQCSYQAIAFLRITRVPLRTLLPGRRDLERIKRIRSR
ncbi:MAG TPA: polysaccharide biosynthesis C-terminal domain-containing protein [Flavobacteriales bacterium]